MADAKEEKAAVSTGEHLNIKVKQVSRASRWASRGTAIGYPPHTDPSTPFPIVLERTLTDGSPPPPPVRAPPAAF